MENGISGFRMNVPYAWNAPCVGAKLITSTCTVCWYSENTARLAGDTHIAIAVQKCVWRRILVRCDLCPLSDPEDTCPEAEGKFGIEHKDGMLGCKHPRNWVEKRDEEYSSHLGAMGLDMGIEMDMPADELERVIEICKHMVGLDSERPYHRHGKAFYRAYRNYYGDVPEGNRLLDKLPECLFRVHRDERGATYHLTKTGLEWLGRWLKIKITVR